MQRSNVVSIVKHAVAAPFAPVVNDESRQVIIMKARALLECLAIIPAKYLWAQITNEKLEPCCRKPENLTLEIRKTQDIPEIVEPDLYVMQCGCGRKHRRLLLQPGQYGATVPEPNINPLLPKELRYAKTDA